MFLSCCNKLPPDFIRDPALSADRFTRVLKTYLFDRYKCIQHIRCSLIKIVRLFTYLVSYLVSWSLYWTEVIHKTTQKCHYFIAITPTIHESILIIFGTGVTEKVGYQNVLYFPTSPN